RSLGHTYQEMGDDGKAMDYYQQSLALARERKDRRAEGSALGALGVVYEDLGDCNKAIEYYEQSLAIERETKDHLGGAPVVFYSEPRSCL
ncbi:tetratricopeptide repeat protein, partial [Trichocoleus sp. FACHB-262]|uniref:tetratricopeptide repeat protein n=1 Tax=Trichocoleus sp. FACHB-262 TaxID=2692869 RepID=UPI001686C8DD